MGGKASAPKMSDEQRRNEQLSAELMEAQLEAAKNPEKLKIPKPPKILPTPPPPASTSADAVEAEAEQRRRAAGRINTARGTLFAGESNKPRTLLG